MRERGAHPEVPFFELGHEFAAEKTGEQTRVMMQRGSGDRKRRLASRHRPFQRGGVSFAKPGDEDRVVSARTFSGRMNEARTGREKHRKQQRAR